MADEMVTIRETVVQLRVDYALIAQRMGTVEQFVEANTESKRHWLRYAAAALVSVGMLFLSAYVGAQFAVG
jgi:hypothetical protein